MLLRSSKLHYPITVIKRYVAKGAVVKAGDKLFQYTYKASFPEGREKELVERVLFEDYAASLDGTVARWEVGAGNIIQYDDIALVELEEACLHSHQFGGMCVDCGKDMTLVTFVTEEKLTDRATEAIDFFNQSLTVSRDELRRIGNDACRRLLNMRKLSLVVDLDQTIIHATYDQTVGEWMKDENNPNYPMLKDVCAFMLDENTGAGRGTWYYVKLRPGLKSFLEEVSKLYELHVYTMATRAYAENLLTFIDPDHSLFGSRIMTRDENGDKSKDLYKMFPTATRMAVIIDDRADVWQWSEHLIRVKVFEFFTGTGDINAPAYATREVVATAGQGTENGTEEDDVDQSPAVTAPDFIKAPAESSLDRDEDHISAIEQQIAAMAGSNSPALLQEQSTEMEQRIAQELEGRPLQRLQQDLDRRDAEAAERASVNGDINPNLDVETAEQPTQQSVEVVHHAVLKDDDTELLCLEENLREMHKIFFTEYDRRLKGVGGGRVSELKASGGGKKAKRSHISDAEREIELLATIPDIKVLMPQRKRLVFEGVVMVFSGYGRDGRVADMVRMARWFGAEVFPDITRRTTHLIGIRGSRSPKMLKAARRPNRIKIVTEQWIHDAISRWERPGEAPYLIHVRQESPVILANGAREDSFDREMREALEGGPDLDGDDFEGEGTGVDSGLETDGGENMNGDAMHGLSINTAAAMYGEAGEEEQSLSPVDLDAAKWDDMNEEVDAFLNASDTSDEEASERNESGDEEVQEDEESEQDQSQSTLSAGMKRKRSETFVMDAGDAKDDGPAMRGEGSLLAKRKKRTFGRTGSSTLTSVVNADDLESEVKNGEGEADFNKDWETQMMAEMANEDEEEDEKEEENGAGG